MKDQEMYRLYLKLFRKVQEKARQAGKESLTDEEVERLALSATEEHETMVAMISVPCGSGYGRCRRKI